MSVIATIKRGQTFRVEIPLTDEAGEVFSLAGYTLDSEARQVVEGAHRTYPLVQELDTSASDLDGGVVVVAALPAETNSWPVGEIVFDVFLTAPDGDVIPMPTYTVKVTERITGYD